MITMQTNAAICYDTAAMKEKPVYDACKRIGDFIGAAGAIMMVSPLLLGAVAVLTASGKTELLTRQTCLGKDGKEFELYRFNAQPGSFLHRSAINELPQLFNILKGDMSVIGPRAIRLNGTADLSGNRLPVKPGLSCYAQVAGTRLSRSEQIALDQRYIAERSLLTDLKLVGRTILHTLCGKNS